MEAMFGFALSPVPPAGFEPAHPAPEAVTALPYPFATKAQVRGLHKRSKDR